MATDMDVDVLDVSGVEDTPEGNRMLYLVSFGKLVDVNPAIRQRLLERDKNATIGTKIIFSYLTIVSEFDGVVPYRIGEKWRLSIASDGSISTKRL